MNRLLVLWDPGNPLTPVAPVLSALRASAQVLESTFETVSHRTMPNRTFELRRVAEPDSYDGLLWIEGGPLPSDLKQVECSKACWLLNAHQEPTLLLDIAPLFDRELVSTLDLAVTDRARFVPLAAGEGRSPKAPEGISLLVGDPKPPTHSAVERKLRAMARKGPVPERPVVVCLGEEGQVHPIIFDALRSGAAVLADPGSDLRNVANVGEHLEVFPATEELDRFLGDFLRDDDRLDRLSSRGAEIVRHLHTPKLRAAEILRALWPTERVLGGKGLRPEVSVLVTCYRYLRRLRICLESLARQDMPPGSIEIVVADPESPDGLAGDLAQYAARHPELRVVRLPLDVRYSRNRGLGINRAFDASSGDVVVAIDGDLVFPPHLIRTLSQAVRRNPEHVYGVKRSFLPKEMTEQVLSGAVDPLARFGELARLDGDGEEKPFVGVLGYCQAVSRKAFLRARYPEEFDMVNQSDIVFVERLARKAAVTAKYLGDETVLHLWHPRNWQGTKDFL